MEAIVDLSIIIPTYNSGDYIEKAIKSCPLGEAYLVEVIVVDDGSTDNTNIIVANLCENLKLIKYYKIENHGLSYARNYGLERAIGEYVLFLDSDDVLYPEVIQKGIKSSEENMIDVWYYRAKEIDSSGGCIREQSQYPFSENAIYTGKQVMAENPKHFIRHEAWRGIYRRSFLKENTIRFIDELYYEDNTFWFDIMCKSDRIIYTNEIGYGYRIRNGSIINSSISEIKVLSVFRICEYLLEKEREGEEYWGAIPGKIAVLIRNCECRLRTVECKTVLPVDFIIEKKVKIGKLIDSKYNPETIEGVKFNYFLSSYVYLSFGVVNEYLEERLESIRKKLLYHLKAWVESFGISNSSVVAFYGSGPNGDAIHQTIEKILGKSFRDLFYIDSNLPSLKRKHNGNDIVNIDDIDMYHPDMIIISSFLYEEEIVDSLKKRDISYPWYACYRGSKCSYDGLIVHNFYETYRKIKRINGRKIFLLLTPEYSNLGDHLITLSEFQFVNNAFPDVPIIEITNDEYRVYKSVIRTLIKSDDYLVITGGGYFGTLWREGHYDEVLDITDYYEKNKIFMMPQSIYFSEDSIGEKYKELTKDYLNNKNIYMCLRERLSFDRVHDIRPGINNVFCTPDIALYYKWISNTKINRENIAGIFLRKDKESITDEETKSCIKGLLQDLKIEFKDSSMLYTHTVLKEFRMRAVEEKLLEISSYAFVITDMLHCMISCVITRTPCIAIDNISGKVGGVYEWISSDDSVVFCKDARNIDICMIEQVRNVKNTNSTVELQDEMDKLNCIFREHDKNEES